MESTFICLLPSKEEATRLGESLDKILFLHVFPCIKLPLHVTLYYFPNPSHECNARAKDWLRTFAQKSGGRIHAHTTDVGCFAKDGRDFVYYLPVVSEKITHVHQELYDVFKDVHTDSFSFVPHLSLFYPQRDLSEHEKKTVQTAFEGSGTIEFDRLAYASEKNGGVHYLDTQIL